MRVIIVDDDLLSRTLFASYCENIKDVELVGSFSEPEQVLKFAATHSFDLAALDVMMPGMNGVELGRELQKMNPHLVLIFITASEDFAMEAFRLKAASYIVKPFEQEAIADALNRGKKLCMPTPKQIYIRTFGHFDLFIDGKALVFSRQKSKELLAYLVDRRGGTATMEQIICDLWEDRVLDSAVRSSYQAALKDLRKNLKEAGISELLNNERNQKSVNIDMIDCDYYRLLKGDPTALESYQYEYMVDYSWAEATNAYCTSLKWLAEKEKQEKENKI